MLFLDEIKKRFFYYFGSSYRRRLLDSLQDKHRHLYRGVVLDIGGRDRGLFRKPKQEVDRWIFADIEPRHKPDIVLDVTKMDAIDADSIDVIGAMELFEHVEDIEQGLRECYRCLKLGGTLIISCPFLYAVHGDPYDFQRWTDRKWSGALRKAGFCVEKIEITGRFFTVRADMTKFLIGSLPGLIRKGCYLFYPILDLVVRLDKTKFVLNNQILSKHHGGYFIVARKQ